MKIQSIKMCVTYQMSILPAIQEAEAKGSQDKSHSGHLSEILFQHKTFKMDWVCGSVLPGLNTIIKKKCEIIARNDGTCLYS